MKTENNIPPAFATTTHANLEGGVQADVYLRHEKPVAVVLWRGNEPQPYVAFKDSDDGRLTRFAVTANDDVPKHDRRESHLNVQAEVFTSPQNEAVRGVALYKEREAEPFLTVTGAGAPMRLYPFNERSNGIFANDFRDRDGLPVADTFGATMRAVLHGREARDWPVVQTAKLVAEYSSDQMARLMEVVNVRSRDDEWRVRYQDKGLAGSEELASIMSSRWPQTYRPADDKEHPFPLVAVEVEPNTFSFYVTEKDDKKMVRVHQFTDFRGTMLEDDFPLGSTNEWSAGMPKTFTDMEAVNAVGRSLLKDWESLPKTFPAAEAPPYDPNDMDAAVAYSKRTKALFADGDHDGAYALYMRDPNGGAQTEFSKTTKEHFVVGMYNTRDVQGKPLYPQPEGYQYAGFTVGHEAHLRDDKSWAKIGHLFEFDGKPYVMLEFDQPVSTFTDGDGRLQVLRGVAAAERPAARDTRLLVAAEQIDGTRPVADRALNLGEIKPVIENAYDFLDDRLAGTHTDTERQHLLDTHRSLHLLREQPVGVDVDDARRALQSAHDLINDRWALPSSATGRQAMGVVNDLRTAMTYLDHGLDAVGGKLPKRAAPQYELRQLADDKLSAAFHTSAHAKNALDVSDEGKPMTYYVVNAQTGESSVSFAARTELKKQGRTEAEFFEARANAAPELTDDQRAAVVAFRDANGRDWKDKLGALWMNGSYSRRGIDMDQAALLQQVRNQLGPEWLANVTRADLDAKRVERDDADLSM